MSLGFTAPKYCYIFLVQPKSIAISPTGNKYNILFGLQPRNIALYPAVNQNIAISLGFAARNIVIYLGFATPNYCYISNLQSKYYYIFSVCCHEILLYLQLAIKILLYLYGLQPRSIVLYPAVNQNIAISIAPKYCYISWVCSPEILVYLLGL